MLKSVMALQKPPGTLFLDGQMNKPVRDKLDISTARNGLIEDFLKAHETFDLPEPLNWLLMLDGDCIVHPGTLHRLSSWNRAAVGALCVTRYKPYQPVVYRGLCKETAPDMRSYYVQWKEVLAYAKKHPGLVTTHGFALLDPAPEDALHQVDWTGSHCFLIHRSVYEKLEPPWFVNASNPQHGSGSDRLFFEKVVKAGFGVYVDYSVVAGHLAEISLGLADFAAWQSISMEQSPTPVEHYVGDDTVHAVDEKDAEWYDKEFLNHPHFSKPYEKSAWWPLWSAAIEVLKANESKVILDLGCGPGQVGHAIWDNLPSLEFYVGLDFSPARIAQAETLLETSYPGERREGIRFVCGDVYEPESLIESTKYDTVLMTEFLEHVTRDLEIMERVKPGTLVVATVPDFLYEGHVRAFSSVEDVRERYGHLLEDMHVEGVKRAGGYWFLFWGVRA
jgi:SAM-dependent methyltransferase